MRLTSCARLAAAGLIMTTLSGCFSTGNDMAQLLIDSVEGYDALGDGTPTMPTSGTATYSGSVTGFVGDNMTDRQGRMIAGEATMTARFTGTGGDVSGTLTNFIGRENVDVNALDAAVRTGDVAAVEAIISEYDDVSGTIRIRDGKIGGREFTGGKVSGNLNHNGDTLAFGGEMGGIFNGKNAEGMKAYSDTDNGWSGGTPLTINENGDTKAGMLYVNTLQ